MNAIRTIIILFILIPSTLSLDITCDYLKNANWGAHIEKIYRCKITNKVEIINRGEIVTSVSENHVQGYSNDKVTGIHVIDCNFRYFPTGFEKFYPNLLGLSIEKCKLMEISQNDLKGFPKLQHLWIKQNSVKVIEKDLFKYNPNMTYINFNQNSLNQIDEYVFDNLKKLKHVHLLNNECINLSTQDSSFVDIIAKIRNKCRPNYGNVVPESTTEVTVATEQSTMTTTAILKVTKIATQKASTLETSTRFSQAPEPDNNKWIAVGCGGSALLVVSIGIVGVCFVHKKRANEPTLS